MGMIDTLMGRTQIDVLEEKEKKIYEEIKNLNILEGKIREKAEKRLYKNAYKFFKQLYKLGVEVELSKEEGGKIIKTMEDIKNIPLLRLYQEYIVKTLQEVNKEIDRRIKEDED